MGGWLPKLRGTWPQVRLAYPFRPRRQLLSLIPLSLREPVEVTADDLQAPTGRLADIWRSTGHSQKSTHYFPVYESALAHLVGAAPRLLEIGVSEGGSLPMWQQYLGDGSTIVGIDIDPACRVHARLEKNIHVVIGAQAAEATIQETVDRFGPFDAVIDDGSHRVSDMIRSFGLLFANGLKAGGTYIVEDTHSTYWSAHRDRRATFGDFVRDLIDLQHAAYWHAPHSSYFDPDASNRLASATVPRLATMLGPIEAHDSIVVIHKRATPAHLPQSIRSSKPA